VYAIVSLFDAHCTAVLIASAEAVTIARAPLTLLLLLWLLLLLLLLLLCSSQLPTRPSYRVLLLFLVATLLHAFVVSPLCSLLLSFLRQPCRRRPHRAVWHRDF
jgi:hypothetical protein